VDGEAEGVSVPERTGAAEVGLGSGDGQPLHVPPDRDAVLAGVVGQVSGGGVRNALRRRVEATRLWTS
jgi:hypothetical protein